MAEASIHDPGHPLPRIGGHVLLGITGAVQATAMPQIIFLFKTLRVFDHIDVVMSAAATAFVSPYVIGLHTTGSVYAEHHESAAGLAVPHIELTRACDLMLVMPATANVLGKAAHGICDDVLTTSIVASESPVVFVPSMNHAMWKNPVVRRNVASLREFGYHVVDPGPGLELSEVRRGEIKPAVGAMAPVHVVLAEIEAIQRGQG